MWERFYGKNLVKSTLPNCPECVGREWEKKKKAFEVELEQNDEEMDYKEMHPPSYYDVNDELDLPMKLDLSTKHFICKRCGLFATREQISDIKYKLTRKEKTRADKQDDYLEWWQKSKNEK